MPNQLIHETSPYLLQHANNPVNWYPWGEAALAKAKVEDKPIFLSIGYAACHWCHVMGHESFEDPAIAYLLNQGFISIKVDREERPDLDHIYMDALVAMTGQGGWPASVFLTPDGQPFYAGTYFPPERINNIPSFREILVGVEKSWKDNRANIFQVAQEVTSYLKSTGEAFSLSSRSISIDVLNKAVDKLTSTYDWKFGGWGKAPKFPQPMVIEFLLLQATRGNKEALKVATHALQAMNRGGLYDVVAGGFHRYSTDANWQIPHFEKMLYDNAQLALAYLHAYLITGNDQFRVTCEETLAFLENEMRNAEGGFYSSLDADAEGEEGKYYLWSPSEVRQVISDANEYQFLKTVYPMLENVNFNRKIIFQRQLTEEELAEGFGLTLDDYRKKISALHRKLNQARKNRIYPAIDDKVIVSWNALALQAFAEAGRYLNNPRYLELAQENAEFLLSHVRLENRLMRSWRGGKTSQPAFLEDFAFLFVALIMLYQADSQIKWFENALDLADEMLINFRDEESFGLYDTSADQGDLLLRPKETQDNVIPSGNSMAAYGLMILATYQDRPDWLKLAENMLSNMSEKSTEYPTAFAFWLRGMDFQIGPVHQIVVVWREGDPQYREFVNKINAKYQPRAILASSEWSEKSILAVPVLLQNRVVIRQRPTVYICKGFVCKLPVDNLDELERAINSETAQ
jgi:uncharacterized protein